MDRGWLIFWTIVATVVGLAVYIGHCRFWPYADCYRCKGRGKFRSKTGRSWRRCRRCKGSGERVRYGRRMWSWLAMIKHKAID